MSAGEGIAIVGLAVRFPGADSVEAFWQNLRQGTESVSFFSDEELRAAGIAPATIADPRYVRANGVLRDADKFDAAFFGMTPREAEAMDPQHRVFLELAWEAMERAGYDAARTPGRVGVFAGAGMSTYLLKNLAPNRAFVESAGELALLLGNNKDFVPTRVSYKLNLRGPSVNVNTACSTSLVATHLAVQSLLDLHCDLAMAGGVAVQVPQVQGYFHTEGGIGSPDGHCRAFDVQARGTVSGNGAGIVVLKRLADALADGDTIHAVIRGSAVNNDGADKVGFTAPSVAGQSQVIAEALAVAGLTPAEISYVEAHGTGTELGDPIEVAALTQVFGDGKARAAKCALGSVKTNFGHLDEAAGVAGLVKTALALQHRELPASLHFTRPNPKIDFARSAFAVNAKLTPWSTAGNTVRRAGVSSFGIGGTNAHVVLEEPPALAPTSPGRSHQLIVLSAKTKTALARAAENLAQRLAAEPTPDLADAAYTLALGRKPFAFRRAIVARDAAEAVTALRAGETNSAIAVADAPAEVVFMFSGQGAQYPGMMAGLYASDPAFRAEIDRCAAILRPLLGFDLRELLASTAPDAAGRLRRTAVAQPAVFLADYALAKLWQSWGVQPAALIGHSLGEYVAACLAGVFSLEDALALVAARGALMDAQPAGAMLAVALGEDETAALGRESGLAVAAINAADSCVLSGAAAAIETLAAQLTARGVAATRLETSHAFHSPAMDAVMAPFAAKVRAIRRNAPQLPIASNLTGKLLTAAEATDPEYWARHLRAPVRFGAGIDLLREKAGRVLLEVGPGRALSSMARRTKPDAGAVLTSTRAAAQAGDDVAHLLATAGALWQAGVALDWEKFFGGQKRRRVVLPTYPFERQRYWIDAPGAEPAGASLALAEWVPTLAAAEARLAADPACVEAPTYPAFTRQLDAWCGVQLLHYFATAGEIRAGARQQWSELRTRLGVQPAFHKAAEAFLAVLVRDGHVRRHGDEIEWLRGATDVPSVVAGRQSLLACYPEFRGIVRLVEHCTSQYPAALSGKIPAITVLYPEGRSNLLETTARENARHTNKDVYLGVLREALERRLAAAGGRKLRILEVGVGDRLLAGRIAPALKGRNVEYVATDLGRTFVAKAEKAAAAAGLDFLTFGVLDISRDPVAQGFDRGSFDAVICLDVVHATPRLAETLDHLRTLLAPGGMFGIVEKVRPERWIDLVWGLAEGWWYFADTDVRRHGPLLAADGWEKILHGLRFRDVAVFPQNAAARAATDYALLLAQTDATAKSEQPVEIANWFHGPVWRQTPRRANRAGAPITILADEGGVTVQLAERLRREGATVAVVKAVDAIAPTGKRPAHLVHVGGISPIDDLRASERSFFELTRLAGLLAGSSGECVVSIVSSHACAVTRDEVSHPGKALLTGPRQLLPLECPGVTCRQIDVADLDDAALELLAPVQEPLVAWRAGKRWVQDVRVEGLATPAGSTGLRERGVYLITGGFGSMGLAFARELARSVCARIALVSRTSPSAEKLGQVRAIEALGGEVLCVTADVSDPAQLAQAVRAARERFGAIHGAIHTAGVYGQGAMWERSAAAVAETWAPKIAGTVALAEALAGETLDFLVLCSSLASLRPVAGQADYCAANAFLDAWAGEHARRTGTRTISIAWGMWQELGMMGHASIATAQQQSVRDEIAREGWQDAGVAVLRRVLAHAPSGVVFVSPQPLPRLSPPAHPWLKQRVDGANGRVDYVVRLDPKTDWVVDEHRLDGRAILPGTAFLELARAAFADFSGASAVELDEVYFLSPLLFERDEAREARVILRDGSFHVVSRVGEDRWLEHARGEVRVAASSGHRAKLAVGDVQPVAVPADAVRFGPRWRNLQALAFSTHGGTAKLALAPELAGDVAEFALHPALLDMATGFVTLRHALPDSLPFSYRRVVAHAPLSARVHSVVRVVKRTALTLEIDAALTDESGERLVEIEGYKLRRFAPAAVSAPAAEDNVRLTIGAQGTVDALALLRAPRRAPGPGEVEIQVEAAGLNFIEVLYALGMLPAAPELENSFGLECAGRIVAVGAGVDGFAVGDAVVAYANGCFAAFVTAPANAIARRPAGLGAAEAATLPAAFATAHQALVTQARLAAGERVLIHAAAGGVGMAAVQIALGIGAEVFATAGSPEKRAALRALGVKHVMDSRSLAFVDEVRSATHGRGVDVVLNSLGGEFMTRSLELVAPRGRFLELGKRDLFKGGALPLQPFTRIISFIVIDVGPDLPGFPALWREVAERFASGAYRPLPRTTFALTAAREAFDFMARAKHTGKVVLAIDDLETLRRSATAARSAPVGRSLAAIIGVVEPALAKSARAVELIVKTAAQHARPDLGSDYVAPADDVETAIAAIWQELLGIERVGARDNFFDLNGDSLLAAQVTARIHGALQVKLPLSVLFDAPTVTALAERVRAGRTTPPLVTSDEAEEGEI